MKNGALWFSQGFVHTSAKVYEGRIEDCAKPVGHYAEEEKKRMQEVWSCRKECQYIRYKVHQYHARALWAGGAANNICREVWITHHYYRPQSMAVMATLSTSQKVVTASAKSWGRIPPTPLLTGRRLVAYCGRRGHPNHKCVGRASDDKR